MYQVKWAKGKSKYGNKTQEYGGRKYDSKREAAYAMELDYRMKAGEIKEIIPQYKIDIRVNGKHITNYYCDFKVVLADGQIEFHEVKGVVTEPFRLKWLLLEALIDEIEPGAEMIIIK